MTKPLTYAISSGEATDSNFEAARLRLIEQASMLAENSVTYFQIREKQLAASNLYSLATDVCRVLEGSQTRLLINDRSDIAASVGAFGIHLASNSLSAKLVKKCFGDKLAIFVSTHTTDEIGRAVDDGADAVVFGPVFPTPGKSETIGIEGLREAVLQNNNVPIIALGGIDAENCGMVMRAGATGVAGIRSFSDPSLVGS
ncbi:MAG TPA: thiamine phosphate synthase, partial [Pyrinomonadaceae bacterium]|nr:thiamine phosphate synthase [Pyrinomonadaceae bacterium]